MNLENRILDIEEAVAKCEMKIQQHEAIIEKHEDAIHNLENHISDLNEERERIEQELLTDEEREHNEKFERMMKAMEIAHPERPMQVSDEEFETWQKLFGITPFRYEDLRKDD